MPPSTTYPHRPARPHIITEVQLPITEEQLEVIALDAACTMRRSGIHFGNGEARDRVRNAIEAEKTFVAFYPRGSYDIKIFKFIK